MKEEKEVITVKTKDQTDEVNHVLSGKKVLGIDNVFEKSNVLIKGTLGKNDKPLVKLSEFKFGDNEQKSTRRPQGVAQYGKYIINGWYFTSKSKWDGNCKLTVTDISKSLYFNLVPVALDDSTNTFKHIDSHAGGLTVIGNYLYLANGKSILIFDLSTIYKIDGNPDPTIASDQKFIYEYTYLIPQVGKIDFVTHSGARASYMSLVKLNSQNYFLIGNFYSTVKSGYEKGGKSMIWLFPAVNEDNTPFATIKTDAQNSDYYQIEPLFPSGDEQNKTITRIQGAIIRDNVLIINRSYSDQTYQLIVMKYSDILNVPLEQTGFFSGTNKDKHSYDKKNWLKGCEDLECEYNDDDNDDEKKKIWTVTEFGDRSVYSADYKDIINLIV